jgi:hypothetical protein
MLVHLFGLFKVIILTFNLYFITVTLNSKSLIFIFSHLRLCFRPISSY